MRDKLKSDSSAEKRLHLLTALKVKLAEARDNLDDESHQRAGSEKMQKLQLEIKREQPVGRQGGSLKWPVHIVLLICELLVNDTPPSAVPANIQMMSDAMTVQEVTELPCIKCLRQCSVVVKNLKSTLAALRLGEADERHQLFTDGTSKRRIAFQNLVIAVMVDSKLNPVIVSSCMLLEDETSDNQVKSIVKQVRLNVNMLCPSTYLSYSPTFLFYPYSARHIEAVLKVMETSHSP